MAIPELRRRVVAVLALAFASAGCSVANLSYAEVARDLDEIARVEGTGADQRLAYQSDVRISPWYSRWTLLLPLKPLLLLFLPDGERVKLENPSGHVRDLLVEIAPKAGNDLLRTVATVQRLVRVLALDPSALNRICALDGLGTLAAAQGIDLVAGLERGELRLQPPAEAPEWLAEFTALRPARREPVGSPLSPAESARYRSVLAALTAQPLPSWQQQLALVADLTAALADEADVPLREVTTTALRNSLRHAVQWAVVRALSGQSPALVDVRLRALELLHAAGGPDSVPLLLALMANSPENIAAGEPAFDPDIMMQRRLIHLCGQLDKPRALRSVRLPGRDEWQAVPPAEFLARIVLKPDAFLEPLTLPAREALARSLGRDRIGLADDLAPDAPDWVVQWHEGFLKSQATR